MPPDRNGLTGNNKYCTNKTTVVISKPVLSDTLVIYKKANKHGHFIGWCCREQAKILPGYGRDIATQKRARRGEQHAIPEN